MAVRTEVTIDEALSAALAASRERWNNTMDDVVKGAVHLGMGWRRPTVANIETGKRHLSVAEFLLLPRLLDEGLLFVGEETFLQSLSELGVNVRLTPLAVVTCESLAAAMEAAQRSLEFARPTDKPAAVEAIATEAERRLARRMGVPPSWLVLAVRQIWGDDTLDAERDRTVIDEAEEGASPARLKALRGAVTRRMTEKIRAHIETEAFRKSVRREGL